MSHSVLLNSTDGQSLCLLLAENLDSAIEYAVISAFSYAMNDPENTKGRDIILRSLQEEQSQELVDSQETTLLTMDLSNLPESLLKDVINLNESVITGRKWDNENDKIDIRHGVANTLAKLFFSPRGVSARSVFDNMLGNYKSIYGLHLFSQDFYVHPRAGWWIEELVGHHPEEVMDSLKHLRFDTETMAILWNCGNFKKFFDDVPGWRVEAGGIAVLQRAVESGAGAPLAYGESSYNPAHLNTFWELRPDGLASFLNMSKELLEDAESFCRKWPGAEKMTMPQLVLLSLFWEREKKAEGGATDTTGVTSLDCRKVCAYVLSISNDQIGSLVFSYGNVIGESAERYSRSHNDILGNIDVDYVSLVVKVGYSKSNVDYISTLVIKHKTALYLLAAVEVDGEHRYPRINSFGNDMKFRISDTLDAWDGEMDLPLYLELSCFPHDQFPELSEKVESLLARP